MGPINWPSNHNIEPIADIESTKVPLHCKPDQRSSWEYHGYPVWYVGPSLQHYCCYRCWVPDTGSEVDADMLTMIPTTASIPIFGDKEALEQALSVIVHIIKHPSKNNVPQYWKGDAVHAAFQNIATFIKQYSSTPTPMVITPHSQIQNENDEVLVPHLPPMPDFHTTQTPRAVLLKPNKVQQELRVVLTKQSRIPEKSNPTTSTAPAVLSIVQPQPRVEKIPTPLITKMYPLHIPARVVSPPPNANCPAGTINSKVYTLYPPP
eukprot:11032237-Ditylum_brightwellii.AAC.1